MYIVLVAKGKKESVTSVGVQLFENLFDATEYCIDVTDKLMNEKYWTYAEAIEEGIGYEPHPYKNYQT